MRGLVFFGLVLFFLATSPVNRSEAEDAYDYAWRVETSSGVDLLDGNHLLYFPAMKMLYEAVEHLEIRAFPVLVCFSAVSTAGLLFLVYQLLRRRLGFERIDALLASAALGSCYGVWRYAAEAEIYAISGALALLLLLVAVGEDGYVRHPVVSALIALAGVCMHIMNILPAFAIGVVCIFQRRWKTAMLYGCLFSGAMLLLVALLFPLGWDIRETLQVSPLAYSGGLFKLASYPRALIGLGSGIVSSQFVFGWEAVRQLAVELFPGMMLSEECFFGKAVGASLALTGAVLALACALAFLALVVRLPWRKGLEPLPVAAKSIAMVLGIWCAIFVATIFKYDSAAPEFWIQTIPPLFLLVFSCVALRGGVVRLRIAMLVFTGLLFMHNGLVGILPLTKASTDYNYCKTKPLLELVGRDDLVLTSDNPVYFHYLRYVCHGEVVDLYGIGAGGEDELLERVASCAGSVYAFDDLGNPPPSMRLRLPNQWERVKKLGERLSKDTTIILLQ